MTKEHRPYIPASTKMAELTPGPILVGILLGIIFGASSLYLTLKVGMTVSPSIPIAVLSITLFRGFSKIFGLRRSTVLENNIVQTTGSAGESIAFGIAVTMPALLILGFEMEVGRIMLAACLGGLLGVLMMIPLRYALIVKGHGELTYPEGTACAEVLRVGEEGGTSAKTVFGGFFFGLAYKFLNVCLHLWKDIPEKAITWFKGAQVSAEVSPELLGVGYIIGFRTSCIMVAGGILSSWVLIPMIFLFGDGLATPLFPGTKPIGQMDAHDIWKNYVLYIGAGSVAAAGIISLFQSLPVIIRGAKAGLGGLRNAGKAISSLRTERDMPMPFVILGSLFIVGAIWLIPTFHMTLSGAILIVAFGFLFATVSSRLTGEIGSSSNPISGMTVATLLLTSLIFLAMGWVSPSDRITALTIAAIVCCSSSTAGSISQDLKTGYLLGATPISQQIAILIGALTSALVIGFTLEVLNNASTVYSQKSIPAGIVVPNVSQLTDKEQVDDPSYPDDKNFYHVLRLPKPPLEGPLSKLEPGKYLVTDTGAVKYLVDPGINGTVKARDNGDSVQKYEAPKAQLMSLIIDGIMTQKLPWGLVLLGVAITIVIELCGVASLPVAVGVYLPLSSTMPIFIGGIVRLIVDVISKKRGSAPQTVEEGETGPGVLFSSGLIAGGAICGIALALVSVKSHWGNAFNIGAKIPAIAESNWTSVIVFTVMSAVLFAVGVSRSKKATSHRQF